MYKKLTYHLFEKGMADTWIGGEPDEPAYVYIEGKEDHYPDSTIAWINGDLNGKEQDAYAALFAAAPDLLAAAKAAQKVLTLLLQLRSIPDVAEAFKESLMNYTLQMLQESIHKAKGGHS